MGGATTPLQTAAGEGRANPRVDQTGTKKLIFVFADFCFFVGFWGPGMVPLDPDRNSAKNVSSFVSGALTATPFVLKLIFREPVNKNPKLFFSDGEALREGLLGGHIPKAFLSGHHNLRRLGMQASPCTSAQL